ncbi:carboxyvinyl-carboxyphosphonate phosphorylmutase [Advenella sp. S44]|uniref:isocitrate lyase/PEP mutase family protein n=1 Tax=Advenella sp. S44 TaxID=1982755 RepID=UPI000CC6DD5C|nr:oxaloacetate decarboxylase [Advenella sp. S44]PJX20387.1 carboxyvinyl-carboxyphosphonate phosphorylmutase [Advenella sp. S44]
MQMKSLKTLLKSSSCLLVPGVYDSLSALIAEQSGFQAVYLSGASVAYTRLGRSDVGLTTYTEVEQTLSRIADRISLPIIVDGDTGFGNAMNVMRTVRGFEKAGASMIQLEDQTFPKRCGHLAGKSVIPVSEMCGKLKAALDARHSEDTLILARTDAVAVEGLDAALERAEAYLECGADVLFIEAVRSEEQMSQTCARFNGRAPLLANMVEGGMTPIHAASDLSKIGFSIVIFPGAAARAIAHALERFYGQLYRNGSTSGSAGAMLNFDQLNDLIGTPSLLKQAARYE